MKLGTLSMIFLTCVSLVKGQSNLLPGDSAIAPAVGDQTAPAIALGGDVALAVWADNRAVPYQSVEKPCFSRGGSIEHGNVAQDALDRVDECEGVVIMTTLSKPVKPLHPVAEPSKNRAGGGFPLGLQASRRADVE